MTSIKKLLDLRGRCALITGAAGGLGAVISNTLSELGANLILVDQLESDLKTLASDLVNRWAVDVTYHSCDLEHEIQRSKTIEAIKKSNAEINILINNAAFIGASKLEGWAAPFEKQTINTWRRALEVNLVAIFDLCQKFYPELSIVKGASIINIASIYGQLGPDWRLYENTDMFNPAAYSASKGGLIQLTRWLATTVAPNIRVNSVSPGGIFRGQHEDFIKRYEEKTPLRRMASEDDFRGVIAYLASDLSQYVTGQNISVDGGWGAW